MAGVSTRSVDDLVKALGADTGISESEVSRICAGLDERVSEFRNHPLDHVKFSVCVLRCCVFEGAQRVRPRPCRWRWSSRPASPRTAPARCWAVISPDSES